MDFDCNRLPPSRLSLKASNHNRQYSVSKEASVRKAGAARQASRSSRAPFGRRQEMNESLHNLWIDQQGQDIAEYAVILAVILVLVVGTIRLVGSNANNAFSSVASSVQ
jgi:Flp pilus assembly pilin Flp